MKEYEKLAKEYAEGFPKNWDYASRQGFEEGFRKAREMADKLLFDDLFFKKVLEIMDLNEKWLDKVPTIQFPPHWEVAIIPPFRGALVRFRVKKDNAWISVYLDVYDNLGSMGQPYWEVYPCVGEDGTQRFLMNDTQGLIECIEHNLQQKEV